MATEPGRRARGAPGRAMAMRGWVWPMPVQDVVDVCSTGQPGRAHERSSRGCRGLCPAAGRVSTVIARIEPTDDQQPVVVGDALVLPLRREDTTRLVARS